MTRFAWTGVLLAGALCGCMPNNFVAPPKNVPAAETARPAVPPPVTADQITPANAHEKEQALGSEIDRDMRQAQDAAEPKK